MTFLVIQVIALNRGLNFGKDKNISDELRGEIYFVSNRTDKSVELTKLIKEFEDMHPNVNVKLELIGDVEAILERKAAVGDLPDVTLIPSTIDETQYSKYFLPIDDLGFDRNKIYNYISGVGSDNILYGLSTSTVWNGVIYNRKIFEELGIDKLPENEEEFFEVCKKIKDKSITPIALNYRQSWVMNMWVDIVPYLYDYNLEENIVDGKENVLSFNSDIYKSLNLAKKIYDYGYCEDNILTYDWAQCKEDMINGKVAMIIWNSDFINQLDELSVDNDNFKMFPIPDTSIIKMNGDYKMAVSKNTRYPEVSKEFLRFLFENNRYADAVNIRSSLKSNEETKKMINDLEQFNIPIVFEDDIQKTKNDQISMNEKFVYLKKNVGLNYRFVQNYITTNDTSQIIKDTNNKWEICRENY